MLSLGKVGLMTEPPCQRSRAETIRVTEPAGNFQVPRRHSCGRRQILGEPTSTGIFAPLPAAKTRHCLPGLPLFIDSSYYEYVVIGNVLYIRATRNPSRPQKHSNCFCFDARLLKGMEVMVVERMYSEHSCNIRRIVKLHTNCFNHPFIRSLHLQHIWFYFNY